MKGIMLGRSYEYLLCTMPSNYHNKPKYTQCTQDMNMKHNSKGTIEASYTITPNRIGEHSPNNPQNIYITKCYTHVPIMTILTYIYTYSHSLYMWDLY